MMRPCDIEFGEDHDHDDVECAFIVDTMCNGYIESGIIEPVYLSGSGEVESDSYINYLNRN